MLFVRIFLSYSLQHRHIAESIHAALQAAGHGVFFDRHSLPAGESFDLRILEALDQSDLLIFLFSPSSIEAEAYTLTWQLDLKLRELNERLACVDRESNALMTKLAQQSVTHRNAITARCRTCNSGHYG